MITGSVNENLEAVLSLRIEGQSGVSLDLAVTIDTGFNGHLTLPRSVIEQLDLEWMDAGKALLADGSEQLFDLFRGFLHWDGGLLQIDVECAEMTPLLGMSVLIGSRLTVDVTPGGLVTIDRLPTP